MSTTSSDIHVTVMALNYDVQLCPIPTMINI